MSSGFITEAEIEERRRVRQEEWEKVRKPDEPLQAPEEEYDNRTLFERLEEQRQKKELEYEETHKLKNMIKGLDDDEIEFLDMVDRTKLEQEKRLQNEEAKELQQFRKKAAALKEHKKLDEETKFSSLNESFTSSLTPHNKVLASIVRKRAASDKLPNTPAKKSSIETDPDTRSSENSDSQSPKNTNGNRTDNSSSDPVNCSARQVSNTSRNGAMQESMFYPSAMKCVGVLPGIGSYISDDSSDSDHTSGSDLDEGLYNLRGQKVDKRSRAS